VTAPAAAEQLTVGAVIPWTEDGRPTGYHVGQCVEFPLDAILAEVTPEGLRIVSTSWEC
jgi:hypothetical protein